MDDFLMHWVGTYVPVEDSRERPLNASVLVVGTFVVAAVVLGGWAVGRLGAAVVVGSVGGGVVAGLLVGRRDSATLNAGSVVVLGAGPVGVYRFAREVLAGVATRRNGKYVITDPPESTGDVVLIAVFALVAATVALAIASVRFRNEGDEGDDRENLPD